LRTGATCSPRSEIDETYDPEMQVRVLGPFELLGADQRPLDIGGPKERAVLALLAVHANEVVSEGRLADALWGDDQPRTATRTLQAYLSRLRRVLRDAGDDGSVVLESTNAGWTLRLAPEALDLTAVEAQMARGRAAAGDGDHLGAALAFADALRAWRGRPLDEFSDQDWAVTEAARLAEVRQLVVEERIDAELASGRHAHLVGELEGTCREHPLRERPWAQRMLALYRSGRQAEALRVYQELRTVLTEELGIEPSPAVARLEQAILDHDPALELAAPTVVGPGPTGLAALLFTDLVGSTELLGRVGDEAFDALRREHFEALRETITEVGGREVKSLGDGLMAAFPSVLTACSCAVAIQRRTARQNRRPGAEHLGVRVGIHAGETTQEGDDHFGTVVVTAKRLCDVAGDGEIVASQVVAELMGSRGGFELRELPPLELKGFAGALAACSIEWEEEPHQALPPALLSLRPARFVGREHELGVLDAAWGRARDGARQVVLIAGEPGIGKTALAQHLAEQAIAAGAAVLFGRCDEESVIPFQPFLEALGHHCTVTPPDELRRQLGDHARDLALLLPGLEAILPELGRVVGTGAETERFRIFEVVRSLMATLQAEAPMVLVLDDLHWADRPTLQLLQHLLRGDASSALLVIGTYRDTDLVRTHPLAEVLVELRRANLVDRLPLRGLLVDDVAELVGHRPLAEALWRETEGSPLFLREILRHLEETGAIEPSERGGYEIHRRLDQLGVPEGVREVIGRRLSRLSDDANQVLRLGSVQGRELRLDVLQRIADLSGAQVLDALEQATAAGLVDEHPTELGRWSFTHALVRQALYDELSLTRRVRVHQHVGEALEAIDGDADGPHLAELAHHFTQAAVGGTADKAIDYGRRAGDLAVRQAAYEQGAELFAAALEVAHDLGADDGLVADLLLAQADAISRGGDPRAARTLVRAVVDLIGDKDPQRLARAAIVHFGDDVRTLPVEMRADPEGIALVERALAAMPTTDHMVRARLLGVYARAHMIFGADSGRVREAADESVAMARRLGDTRALIFLLHNQSFGYLAPADAQRRVDLGTEALALALDLGEVHLQYFGHAGRLVALFELNRIDELRREIDVAAAVLEQTRSPYDLQQFMLCRAVMAIHEGRFAAAEQLIQEGYALGQEVRDLNTPFLFGAAIMNLRVVQGRTAELLPLLEQMAELLSDLPELVATIAAALAAKSGLHAEARRLLDDHPVEGSRVGDTLFARVMWAFRAETYELLDDAERAERLYHEALPHEGEVAGVLFMSCGTVAEALGRCAATAGWSDRAEQHFERALASGIESGWAPFVARVQARLATLLSERDDAASRSRAVELASEALAGGERLGMEPVRTEAQAVLHALVGSPAPVPAEAIVATRRDRLRALLLAWGRAGVARWTRDHSDEDLVRRFGTHRAQRVVFGAMARGFQPAMAFGFEGEIEFELLPPDDHVDPSSSDWWTLEVSGRRADAREGRAADPAVTLHLGVADLVRLGAGELRPLDLVESRRARFEGQLDLGVRVPSMFGILESTALGV
jgi:DNA-binding SARP family transcriptional activator/tetratricopeptide (TPR) repeat protein